MVSPLYKGGYGSGAARSVAPDGESAVFTSIGVFAGIPWDSTENTYIARRGDREWITTPLQPPAGSTVDFSADLRYALGSAIVASSSGSTLKSSEGEFLLHSTDAPDAASEWSLFGGRFLQTVEQERYAAVEVAASQDFCHVVVGLSNSPLIPEAVGVKADQPYDFARECDGSQSSLKLVALNNTGTDLNPSCQVELGTGFNYGTVIGEQGSSFNVVSADGTEIFFTTSVESGSKTNCAGSDQVFVRLNASRTLEVSRPLDPTLPYGGCTADGIAGEVPCEGAATRPNSYFKGASEDGSRVYFTTTAKLTSGDEDAENDLYLAVIGCPTSEPTCTPAQREVISLTQVSHDSISGQAASVQGVVAVASDGSHIYFVARGVLSSRPDAEGQTAINGADNLYVYDISSGQAQFVSDLCSGPNLSGESFDTRCPTSLTSGSNGQNDVELWRRTGEAQTADDGRFLAFSSFGRLRKDDTDVTKDIYRYDADTGALDRVSLGEAGYKGNGNDDALGASIKTEGIGLPGATSAYVQHGSGSRAIGEDGSRIVFTSAAPLSPNAVNGLSNIYEWHKEPTWTEGQVSMVSSGNALAADFDPAITPSGRDIFFGTFQGLVAQDTEGESDLYDARLGGGFPPPPAPRQPCAGDGCQGPLTNPAPLLVPATAVQAPGENLPSPKKQTARKKSKKKHQRMKKTKHKRRGKAKATARHLASETRKGSSR